MDVREADIEYPTAEVEYDKSGHPKTSRQKAVSAEDAQAEYETYDRDRPVEAKNKVSRQKAVSEEAEPEYSMQSQQRPHDVGKNPSRQKSATIEDTEPEYSMYDQERQIDARKKASRQKSVSEEAEPEYSVQSQQRPHDVGKKVSRQKAVSEDAEIEYSIYDQARSVEMGKKTSRQKAVSEEADPEYSVQSQQRSVQMGKNPSRQKSATIEEAEPEYSIYDQSRSVEMGKKTSRQKSVSLDAEAEYLVYDRDRPVEAKNKASRQKAVGFEEANPEYSLQSQERQPDGRKKATRQKSVSEKAEPEYAVYNQEAQIDMRQTVSRQKSVSEEADAEYSLHDQSRPVETKKKISRQKSVTIEDSQPEYAAYNQERQIDARKPASRQKATTAKDAQPEYLVHDQERQVDGRKPVSRQKSVDDEDAGVEGIYVEELRRGNQSVQSRHVEIETADSGQYDAGQSAEARDETEIRTKTHKQRVISEQEAGFEYDEARISKEQPNKPKRRVQFAIDVQPDVINVDAANHQHNNSSMRSVDRRKVQATISDERSTVDETQARVRAEESQQIISRRKTQIDGEINVHGVADQGIEPEDETVQRQHRDRQAVTNRQAAVQETEPLADIATREARSIPNSRPVKHQAETGVMIAIRAPQLNVKTRIEQALERSRKQNAIVEQQISVISLNPADTGVKVEEVKGSNHRQYSAKQDEEVSGVMVLGHRTDSNDVNKNSNRRQQSAGINGDNQHTTGQSDLEVGTRLVADKQKVDGRVDEADLNQHSGILNPVDEDAGIDPVSLEAANAKKHVAREHALETTPDTVLYEDGANKSGLEINTRARILMIDPSIFARGQAPIRLRRKIKL